MKKLIITADDYGMSRAVNDAIDAGIEAGVIKSTNIMTNMPLYKEAVKYQDNPKISLGLHWVLSCGRPVLSPREIPSLVSESGNFYSYPEFRNRVRKKQILYDDIKKELLAQYHLYYDAIGQPDYWNTHQNVHVDFGVYHLFVEIAAELKIFKMRSHQRIYVPASGENEKLPLRWRVIEPVKSRMLDCWQNNAHKKGIASPEGLIVCISEADNANIEYVFANINWKSHEIGEYVIHPATECDSPFFGKISDQRIREYNVFSDGKLISMFQKNGIELVNYNSL